MQCRSHHFTLPWHIHPSISSQYQNCEPALHCTCTPLLWCHKILGNKTVCSVRQYANLNGRHRTTEKESPCLFIVSHNLNRCVTSHINICMYVLLLCYYMTA